MKTILTNNTLLLSLLSLFLQLTSDLKIREADESSPEGRAKGVFVKVTPAGSILESLESRFKR